VIEQYVELQIDFSGPTHDLCHHFDSYDNMEIWIRARPCTIMELRGHDVILLLFFLRLKIHMSQFDGPVT
jgi:hypothetical protein